MTGVHEAERDFWLTSGFRLLRREGSRLWLSDDFLRAYIARPELDPVPESCPVERALRQALLDEPRLKVDAERLAAMADPDARENYEVVLAFRDFLIRHQTIEAAYLALFRGDRPALVPPQFVDQLVHVIVRHLLDGCTDPLRLRAGELLFRSQKVSLQDGAIMLADEETVEMHAATGPEASLVHLLEQSGSGSHRVELDVLSRSNAELYWSRSDRFDTVLDITFGRPGLDAFCRVLEAWVGHMLGAAVRVQPVQSIKDDRWSWHVGLDSEVSGILNDLYNGVDVGEERLSQVLSLFRLEFEDPAVMLPRVAGRPVYLGMAMTSDNRLRLKPQNLLVNLPVAAPA